MSIYNILKDRRRLELNLAEIGLTEVPLVGVNIQTCAADRLPRHRHEGIFEVVYMVRGKQVFTIEGKEYTLKSNDVFITQPGYCHGSGSNLMEKSFFYWLQIKLPVDDNPILCLNSESSKLLSRHLNDINANLFVGNRKIAESFENIFRLYQNTEDISKLAISSRLVELLLNILDCANKPNNSPATADIEAAIMLLEDNSERFVTIEEMATAAGLSSSRFKFKFKEQTGLPPAEYQLRRKISDAQSLLKTTNRTITSIAYELGFSSSQYFATVYKRFTHSNPSDCRKR